MRKLIFCLFVCCISMTAAYAVGDYQEILNECDKIASKKQKNALSTIAMVQLVDEQIDCYKNVVNKIINTEYAQNKQKMKAEFDKFRNISSELAYSMQYPDSCNPNCGTMVGLNAASSELEIIKTYVQRILYIVSPE